MTWSPRLLPPPKTTTTTADEHRDTCVHSTRRTTTQQHPATPDQPVQPRQPSNNNIYSSDGRQQPQEDSRVPLPVAAATVVYPQAEAVARPQLHGGVCTSTESGTLSLPLQPQRTPVPRPLRPRCTPAVGAFEPGEPAVLAGAWGAEGSAGDGREEQHVFESRQRECRAVGRAEVYPYRVCSPQVRLPVLARQEEGEEGLNNMD